MKKFFIFTLVLLILLSSVATFAAEGDIIHTGTKKLFKLSDQYKGLKEAILSGVDKKGFYKEDENGNYVNIVAEEDAQLDYLGKALLAAGVDLSDSDAISEFLSQPEIDLAMEKISKGENPDYPKVLFSFSSIPNGGTKDDYYGPSPKVEASKDLLMGELAIGTDGIGAIKVNSLDESSYMIFSLDTPLSKVYENDNFPSAKSYVPGNDFEVAKEEIVLALPSNFKKYVYLLKMDNGRIAKYNMFEVDKNNISLPPTLLKKDVNYTGPVPGGDDGTTQFTLLDLDGATFKYVKDTKKINIPVDGTSLNSVGTILTQGDLIPANVGDYFLLVAVDSNNKAKAYARFVLTEEQIKSITPNSFPIYPGKGNGPSTAMVKDIILSNSDNKWLYAIGDNLADPVLDKIYAGALSYTLGDDIKAIAGQRLMIFETDSSNKVKRFGKADLTSDDIKAALALNMGQDPKAYYLGPVKGGADGTTIFEFLRYEGLSFKYVLSDSPIVAPEMDSASSGFDITIVGNVTNDIEIFGPTDPLLKNDNGFTKYMMVMAVNGDKQVKAFANFILNTNNVKLPEAEKLNQNGLTNYTPLMKGVNQNSTRIDKLDPTGLGSVSFRYKIVDENIKVELNSKLGAAQLREKTDITGSLGKWLLILAVDGEGRTKFYDVVELTADNIRSSNANELKLGEHYTRPIPGDSENSTKFDFLKLPVGDLKWMSHVQNTPHGSVEAGVKYSGSTILDGVNKDIPAKADQFLLLLATDASGNVIASAELKLVQSEVRSGIADDLLPRNYTIEKGSKANTTMISKFDPIGIKDSGSTRWKVKWVATEPTENKDKPYYGGIIDGIPSFYSQGSDIAVQEISPGDYGYLLLLATDSSGRTKSFKYIKLDSTNVRVGAPTMNLTLSKGTANDTTKVDGLSGTDYAYLISTKIFPAPYAGDPLPLGFNPYSGGDIKVKLGEHLTIFKVVDGKIGGSKGFVISSDMVKQADVSLKLSDGSSVLLEGDINKGGKRFSISLTNGSWVQDIDKNPGLRDKLYRSLVANNQSNEWSKVVSSLISAGFGNITISGNTLNIALVNVIGYDIGEEQEIKVNIHPDLIGAINPISSSDSIKIKPSIKANISGTVVSGTIRKSDIVNGGATIVIELADGYWKDPIDKNALMGSFSSSGGNWSNIAGKIKDSDIIRTSNKVVTITLPPIDIDVNWTWGNDTEAVSVKVHKDLLIEAVEDAVAAPSFNLYPDILKITGEAKVEGNPTDTIKMKAPDGKEVREDANRWKISVTNGTLKDDLSIKDLTITGLPKGLVTTATKVDNNIIDIVVSGTSATSVVDTTVLVMVNGTAVTQPKSVGSDGIELKLVVGEALAFDGVTYEISGGFLKFSGITDKMEYSSNSVDWTKGSGTEISLTLEPKTVYIREIAQPKISTKFVFVNGDAPVGVGLASYDYTETHKVKVKLSGVDKDTMEYRVNEGSTYMAFNSVDEVITLNPTDELKVRLKSIDTTITPPGKLPSNPTPKLNGIYLGDVVLAAGEGKILNTSASMAYSLGSSNGTDGIWEPIKGKDVAIAFSVGDKVWIKDNSNVLNYRPLGTIQQSEKPILTNVDYDITLGKIANGSNQDLEYRFVGGQWETIWGNEIKFGITFKPGTLEFRVKAVGDILASLPETKGTIAAMKSMPVVKFDDVTNKVVSINNMESDKSWDIFEYRINPTSTMQWSPGDLLKNEDLSGDKNVEIRIKAEKYILPSQTNGTVKFTKNLDMSHVVFSSYANPPVLNGTTSQMQYQIVTVNSTTTWTPAGNGETVMPAWFKEYWDNDLIVSVSLRDGKVGQHDNVVEIVTGNPSNDARLDNIDYKFVGDSVVFSGINHSMEYKLDSDNDWTVGNGNDITFDDAPINLSVRLISVKSVYKVFNIDRPAAPVGIKIKSYTYTEDGKMLSVTFDGFKDNLEYSLDGGTSWDDYLVNTIVTLDNSSDLRFKYKSEDGTKDIGKLSSLSTNKINNGIYLGDVKIDADKQKLINTHNLMEYSVNSTDGVNGTWKPANATLTETSATLKLNDVVWIREKLNIINQWKVGAIGQESKPSLDLITFNISTTKIANRSTQDLEYSMDGVNWVKINADKDDLNVVFKAGKLEFRKQGKDGNFASESVTKATLVEPNAPVVRAVDEASKKIQYFDGADWKDIDNSFRYKIGINGDWKFGPVTSANLTGNTNGLVYVKKISTPTDLESKEATISFTSNLDFAVLLQPNVAKNTVSGTTNAMEYSFDSTTGLDGTWKKVTSNPTNIVFTEGINLWFREINKHSVKTKLIDDLKREELPNLSTDVTYHIANGKITNASNQNLDYRIANGEWKEINAHSKIYGIVFSEGLLEFRRAGTTSTLPSLPSTLVAIKASSSMPVVDHDDVDNKVTSIDGFKTGWGLYEYRIVIGTNTGLWTPGDKLSNEDLSGKKTVEIRKKATDKELASQIKPIDFTKNLVLDHVRLSTNLTPYELNGTTQEMEYKVWLTNGSTTWVFEDWKLCDSNSINTKLHPTLVLTGPIRISKIQIRDKIQTTNIFQIYPEP